jgi:predicted outer membrane protein
MAAPTTTEERAGATVEVIEGQAAPDWTANDNKCVTVVFNPVSGQGDPEERKKRIEEALAQHGYRCQHLVTTPEQGARHFAEQATYAGNAEVKLGQLAMERAQSPAVKDFAQMMVRDHSKAGSELKQAVTRHDVQPPAGLDVEHQRLYDRLSALRGAEFDREYMKAMVDGHKKVKSLLASRTMDDRASRDRTRGATGTSGSTTGATPLDMAVNQWATKSLPSVERHLQTAEQIQANIGNAAAGHAGDRH